MAAAIYCHGCVEATFAWYFQRIAKEGLYLRCNSGLCSKSCDPLDMRGNAGDSRDLRAELLRPKDRPTAETAPHIKHVSMESRLRMPNLGCAIQHTFLRLHDLLLKFLWRCI
jgi:hypothetical protein